MNCALFLLYCMNEIVYCFYNVLCIASVMYCVYYICNVLLMYYNVCIVSVMYCMNCIYNALHHNNITATTKTNDVKRPRNGLPMIQTQTLLTNKYKIYTNAYKCFVLCSVSILYYDTIKFKHIFNEKNKIQHKTDQKCYKKYCILYL